MFAISYVRSTIALPTVAGVILAVTAPTQAYQIVQKMNQAESRDPSGRITVEASVINVIQCNGAGENGGQYYIYQYINRPGFRAIQPPNWGSPIGGQDFATFDQAAAACGTGGTGPDAPLPPQ
jgi:hypothetical protein